MRQSISDRPSFQRLHQIIVDMGVTLLLDDDTYAKPYDVTLILYGRGVRVIKAR